MNGGEAYEKHLAQLQFCLQIVANSREMEKLSFALQKLLQRLNMENRSVLNDTKISNFLLSFAQVEDRTGELAALVFQSVRNFTRSCGFFTAVLFAVRLTQNLIKLKKLRLDDKKLFVRCAAAGSVLFSLLPLVKAGLQRALRDDKLASKLSKLAVLTVSFGTLPQSEAMAMYSLSYCLQGVSSTLKGSTNGIVRKIRSAGWLLLPLSISQLYTSYLADPSTLYRSATKVLDFLTADLHGAFPSSKVVIIEESDKVFSTNEIIQSIKLTSINYKKPTIASVLLRKFIKMNLAIPLAILLKDLVYNRAKLRADWRAWLKETLQQSLKLSATALLSLMTVKLLELKNFNKRVIALVSSLWSLVYYKSYNSSFLVYLFNIALVSQWKLLLKNHKSKLGTKIPLNLLITVPSLFKLLELTESNAIDQPAKAVKYCKKVLNGSLFS